jgi:hypothetical protein
VVQVPYEHKLVDPQNKPEDFKALYASIVHNTDDSAKVPIIVGGRPHTFCSLWKPLLSPVGSSSMTVAGISGKPVHWRLPPLALQSR